MYKYFILNIISILFCVSSHHLVYSQSPLFLNLDEGADVYVLEDHNFQRLIDKTESIKLEFSVEFLQSTNVNLFLKYESGNLQHIFIGIDNRQFSQIPEHQRTKPKSEKLINISNEYCSVRILYHPYYTMWTTNFLVSCQENNEYLYEVFESYIKTRKL